MLTAAAYPDRIARCRDNQSERYQLASGRSANLAGGALVGESWLAVAEVGGSHGQSEDRIFLAAPLNLGQLLEVMPELFVTQDYAHWDDKKESFVAERQTRLGRLIVESQPLKGVSSEQRVSALIELVQRRGLSLFNWSDELQQWRARVMILAKCQSGGDVDWPDLSDATLLSSVGQWLPPYLDGVTKLSQLQKLDIASILKAMLPWPLPQELERLAPERIEVPSGSRIRIDYLQSPPVLAVKLQEMFGCKETPAVANGRIPLMVHLLSPAKRPLQVTQDLASFWRGGYVEVAKEMRGRYPKHPWPEDPLSAEASRYTKRKQGS